MNPLKQDAIDAISKLPEDANMDDIMYRLYVLDKIRKGREAAEQQKTIAIEDLMKDIAGWP